MLIILKLEDFKDIKDFKEIFWTCSYYEKNILHFEKIKF